MSRRLPIYFLIDVSESMVGEPIQQVEEGLSSIIQALKADPVAIETVYISIIIFAGDAKTLIPLQEITNFYPPKFPIGNGTSLSKGLGHLMYEMRRNTIRTTAEQKGDWKPIIFLFTDGIPTDSTGNAIKEWKENWQRSSNMVAISFGDNTDNKLLAELTENVLWFKNTTTASYKEFFKWITASIKTSSIRIENSFTDFELAKFDNVIIEKANLFEDQTKQWTDPNFVVLAAKCQNTKRPYLMKYKRDIIPTTIADITCGTLSYRLVGAYQVDNSYFELCDDKNTQQKINTDELRGAPTCPCCGNQFAFAACSCGNIHCIGDDEINTCPWCDNQSHYGIGDGGFEVNRTQG